MFLSKIEGERQKKIRVKFLFNTADFGPVFSYWRRQQSKKCRQSHAAFFSHEDGAQKSARLRTEPPFLPQKWPVWGFYIFRVGGKRRKKGNTGSKETPMSVELPCHLAGLEEKGEKAEKEKNTYKGNRTHDLWVVVCCDPRPPYTPHPYHIDDGTIFLNETLIYKHLIAKSIEFSASSRI